MGEACSICGYPREPRATCPACGGLAARPTDDGAQPQHLVFHGPAPGDHPHLQPSWAAWQARDFARYVGQCLLAMGLPTGVSKRLPEGFGYTTVIQGWPVFVIIEDDRRVAVEIAVATVPRGQEAPVCRALLEMNLELPRGSRLCLRGALVVLRYCDELTRVPPPRLVYAIEDVVAGASYVGDHLAFTFGARVRVLDAHAQLRGFDFGWRGEPVTLGILR